MTSRNGCRSGRMISSTSSPKGTNRRHRRATHSPRETTRRARPPANGLPEPRLGSSSGRRAVRYSLEVGETLKSADRMSQNGRQRSRRGSGLSGSSFPDGSSSSRVWRRRGGSSSTDIFRSRRLDRRGGRVRVPNERQVHPRAARGSAGRPHLPRLRSAPLAGTRSRDSLSVLARGVWSFAETRGAPEVGDPTHRGSPPRGRGRS